MKNWVRFAAASAATVLLASAAQAATVANSTPAAGWHYGNGNDYAPANTLVETNTDGSQLYGRWHVTGQKAPASDANGVYSFALGTSPLSYDWGLTVPSGPAFAWVSSTLLTIRNLNTGQSVSYNSLIALDNYVGGSSAQNSARLNFAFLSGVGFNPNVNNTYQMTLTSNGNSLSTFAKIGTGAVPEPATWAMMIAGFGLVGASMRRRKVSVAFA